MILIVSSLDQQTQNPHTHLHLTQQMHPCILRRPQPLRQPLPASPTLLPPPLFMSRIVSKKLRICLDPRDLNEALEREPNNMRSVEETMAIFHAMTIFTIVDFKKGYYMVVLHPDSRKFAYMTLEHGRFMEIYGETTLFFMQRRSDSSCPLFLCIQLVERRYFMRSIED